MSFVFLCKCCCLYRWVLCAHTTALLPGALGCSPPSQATTPPFRKRERRSCRAQPDPRRGPHSVKGGSSPAETLSSPGEIWPFFQMCGKGEKAFFSFTKYWTCIPSQLTPKGPWEASGPLWEVFVEPLQGRSGQAVQTQTEQEQPACRQQQTLLPRHSDSAFSTRGRCFSAQPSHVLAKSSMSHRHRQGLPSHPEEHAALPGQRHPRRSWPGTASWFVFKHTGRPDSHAITHRSPRLPSYLVSCTSSTRCITGVGRAGLGERWKTRRKPPLQQYR